MTIFATSGGTKVAEDVVAALVILFVIIGVLANKGDAKAGATKR